MKRMKAYLHNKLVNIIKKISDNKYIKLIKKIPDIKYIKLIRKFLRNKYIGAIGSFLKNNYVCISLVILVSIVLLLFSNMLLASVFKLLDSLNSRSLNKSYFDIKDLFDFQFKYKTYYLITLALIIFTDIKIIFSVKMNFKNINKGQKGTSEFTTLKELKQQYKCVPEKEDKEDKKDEKDKGYEGHGGVVISHYKNKLFIDDSPVNNLVIGTTRSGKGEMFVFPTIDVYSRAKEKSSMIINDPKGELASASCDILKKRGYDIQILNLLEPMRGMSYNPLQLIIDAYKKEDYSTAQLLCNTLTFSLYSDSETKDKFWLLSAQSLVNALILAITKDCIASGQEEKITLFTIANFLAEKGSTEDEHKNNELDNFFKGRDAFDISKMQYATSNFAKGVTRSGIFATAMSKLQIFTFAEIAKMTSKNSYDLSEIGFNKKPVAIFMVTPDYDRSNHVIASIFISQTFFIASKKASLISGGKCKREIVYLLDEFGNMPPIKDFSNMVTVCLGRNIRFNLIIQAYSQLKTLYGENKDTIIGNCGNQIYILTSDGATAKSFSELLGYRTLINDSKSGKALFNKSTTASVDKRELLDKNELMRFKEGEDVVFRVIKRQDNKKNRITPKPIFNTGETTLKFRYEYLNDEFNTSKNIKDLKVDNLHTDVKIEDLVFTPIKKNNDEENKTENKTEEKEEKILTKENKYLIQKIIAKYDCMGDIDIMKSSEIEIKKIIMENYDNISDEDKKELKEIVERS